MQIKATWLWAVGLLVAAAMNTGACGGPVQTETSSSGGQGCTPGKVESCPCPGGGMGVQACKDDGSGFGACECGAGGSGSGSTSSGMTGSSSSSSGGTCGDGFEQSGECTPGSEFYCPQDCKDGGGDGGDPCNGHIYIKGDATIASAGPAWASLPNAGGFAGLEAGNYACQQGGADHVCRYDELLAAQTAGEFPGLALYLANKNAWVHRTTPEVVNGNMSAPGPGGRCNDWTYTTNHISDGEYVTFDANVNPTFHLDNDTFYDGVDTTHQIAGDLQCGGTIRAIICCFPSCN